jgi:hypothetical protein
MAENPTPIAPNKMEVGFNYGPWNCYGNYFGDAGPTGDNWVDRLNTNLQKLKDADITVVRIFLLGNAHNYGTLSPVMDSSGTQAVDSTNDPLNTLTVPTVIPKEMVKQIKAMFTAFLDHGMKVIPSIIDFKAFGRPIYGVDPDTGKPKLINGCTAKHHIVLEKSVRDVFVNTIVRGLLQAWKEADPKRKALYAWEIMNEPYWNCCIVAQLIEQALQSIYSPPIFPQTADGLTVAPLAMRSLLDHLTGSKYIPPADMNVFLKECLQVFDAEKVPSTVGHRFYQDPFPAGLTAMGSIKQFHYYPQRLSNDDYKSLVWADREVPKYSVTNAIVGEIGLEGCDVEKQGTKIKVSWPHGAPWPQLGLADDHLRIPTQTPEDRVYGRLKLLEKQGYPLALIWPARPTKVYVASGEDPLDAKLSPKVQAAISKFRHEK